MSLTSDIQKINIGKDEMLLTDNLRQGFVELCNDGEASSLRLFYLENGEGHLERQQPAVQKRTLVKQLSTFQQISVKHQAYVASNLTKWKNNEKVIPLRAKNWSQKRKPFTSTDIYLCSPSKRLTQESQKEANGSLTKQYFDEPLKEENGILKINSVITKSDGPTKKITSLDDAFLCNHSRQSARDLSTSFERLSAGTDAGSPKGFLNLGNSCYMNAVLQGLFHVEAFKDLLNVVPESSQETILSALKALWKNYQKAANTKKRCLLENVFKFLDDERFEMTEQEAAYSDAQEFLTIILDKIDSELESLVNSKNAEGNHLSKSVMSLSSIFGFELKHGITCNKCGTEQVMYEKGVFLPIQIVYEMNNDSPSLQMLLEHCLKSEVVEHICPRCNEKYATMNHEFRSFSNSLLPISSSSSDDQVSFVLETPPNDLASSGSNNSSNVREDVKQIVQENVSETVQKIDGCDNGRFQGKIIRPTTAYNSNADERLDYLTLFCLPRPDFCERSCAELNIRCRSSAVRQEPKPLFWKSVPSNIAPVVADGNCLFRSIALYLSGSDEEHSVVRKNVVEFEEKYDDQLREVNHFSLVDWKEHIKKMTNDGEWATEIELLALAALLDAEIWTFLNGKWLRYRPLYTVGKDGKSHKLPIQEYDDSGKDSIFLINENFHYKPVLDIVSNGAVCDYHLAAVISHKGISPSNGHYVCDVRNLNRNVWMHFDDSHVEERTEAEVVSECIKDGYIFFYVTEN